MQNDDLKSLVNSICNNLLEQVDTHEDTTKEQIVNYLRESANIVSSIKHSDVTSINNAKLVFSDAYKDIAKASLVSYENTNGKFEELARMHAQTLKHCIEKQSDLPSIAKTLDEIQTHMLDEIKKANEIIAQLTEQVKTLEVKSNIDSLTKVFNRRALTSYLNDICSKKTTPEDFHLLMIDIDDFKKINDKHGHVAGDKVLIFIANIIRKTLRDGDKIFRYGGEEFVVILNRINTKDCLRITQRLLKIVSENKLIYKNESLNVTMSAGSTLLVDTDTPDSLIARADTALYKAKKNGKNQIFSENAHGI